VAGVRSAAAGGSLIDQIVYDGAVRILAAAPQDAVTAFIIIAAHADQLDADSRRRVT
jgi:hypothetical protein